MKESGGFPIKAQEIMRERFGRDALIALATTDGKTPYVRAVNSYYEDGAFYVITHTKSNKMRQIENNPRIAVCGDWFTGHGVGENLGWVLDEKNTALIRTLRGVFAAWYGNGHINESDPNTCILRVRLTRGVLMSHGTRYEIEVGEQQIG